MRWTKSLAEFFAAHPTMRWQDFALMLDTAIVVAVEVN
jgi:hypothetical protein